MQTMVSIAARVTRAAIRAYGEKWAFLALSVLAFASSVYALARFDLLPETPVAPVVDAAPIDATTTLPAVPELPVSIEIPAIGLSAAIANPDTTNVPALDALLLKGAVRYPTSAKLGETGNVVLFGHSSYLPVVGNPAYKTFNGIQKLITGDRITVQSGGTAYVYAVTKVTKEDATVAGIPLAVAGRVLTLATCDSFATKSDRFVVTADFVESHPLP